MHVGVFLSSLNIILAGLSGQGIFRTRSRRIRHHGVDMQQETFDRKEMTRFPIFLIQDRLGEVSVWMVENQRN